MRRLQILWAMGMVLFLGSAAWGQDIEEYALIQGRITLPGGSIPDGNYPMESHLYNEPTGGVPLYEETHSSVAVSGGLFTLNLGSVTPIPDSLFKIVPLWLEMVVNSEVITPRIRLASVPRAFHVRTIDGAKGGTLNGDLNVAGTMMAHPPNPITPGLVIQGAEGQTANLLEIFEAGGVNPCWYVGPDGGLTAPNMMLLPPPDDSKPTMLIQGGLRQTGNLLQIQNAAGTPLLNVDPTGGLHAFKPSSFTGTTRFLAPLAGNIVDYVDADGFTVGSVGPDGAFSGAPRIFILLPTSSPALPGLEIQGVAGQTANFMEMKNSAGSPLLTVGPDGGLHTMGASSFGDNVSVGAMAPANSKLQINGALATAITNTTSNLTLTGEHSVILCSLVSSSITIDLPSAVGIAGRQYTVKYLPPTLPLNGVTIDPFGSETIDGAGNYVLSTANEFVTIVSDGANWWVIAK
ncbi:MAG: hypothetical protein L0196_07775 [candidate division Zixibacteria bacterium]|nr:hypothetical protein [candidate division Zixibacteria bacterium]